MIAELAKDKGIYYYFFRNAGIRWGFDRIRAMTRQFMGIETKTTTQTKYPSCVIAPLDQGFIYECVK